ncbi:MAG: DUF6308 family protein [Chloroflexi bacterium]|nr:DUF6308 family protein [Chloroflexota bacterium]
MSDEHLELELKTCQGALFTIHYAAYLAEFFFRANASSVGPNAYDAHVALGLCPDHITDEDVTAVNQTMVARTSHKHWTTLTKGDADEAWLTALDPGWDLFSMPEKEWLQHAVPKRLNDALDAVIAPYRRPAVTTKVLHIKRPRLIPVCDSSVARTMGVELFDSADLLSLIMHLRGQGQANLEALRVIQVRLSEIGIDRTLVRILDALLWMRGNERGEYAIFEQWMHEVYD